MKIIQSSACMCFAFMLSAPPAMAQSGTLQFTETDSTIERLSGPEENEVLLNTNREPVQFSWTLRGDAQHERRPYQASSRGFWMTVTGAELSRGITLVTDAPGAAVHVAPSAGARSLALDTIEVTDSSGARHSGANALRRFVDVDELRASGVPFASGSVAFELDRSMGAGRMVLRSTAALEDSHRYVVQVVDRNSTLSLKLIAEREVVFEGGQLQATAFLTRGKHEARMQVTGGYLTSPDGVRHAVSFEAAGQGAKLSRSMANQRASTEGLWELNLVAQDATTAVMRKVKTTFALARATARFSGGFRAYDSPRADLVLSLDMEVGDAGRYEVRGILLGQNAQGEQQPAMMGSSAAWFQPGSASIELVFHADKLNESGLRPPYDIVDLQLLDQSRMFPLQTVAHPVQRK